MISMTSPQGPILHLSELWLNNPDLIRGMIFCGNRVYEQEVNGPFGVLRFARRRTARRWGTAERLVTKSPIVSAFTIQASTIVALPTMHLDSDAGCFLLPVPSFRRSFGDCYREHAKRSRAFVASRPVIPDGKSWGEYLNDRIFSHSASQDDVDEVI